jgi:hypothetical protein
MFALRKVKNSIFSPFYILQVVLNLSFLMQSNRMGAYFTKSGKPFIVFLFLVLSIHGQAQWHKHIFPDDAYFNYKTLTDYDFTHAVFKKNAYFDDSKFEKITFFDSAVFDSNVLFTSSVFSNEAVFTDDSVKGIGEFVKTKFSNNTFFYSTIFSRYVNFTKAVFSKDVYFWRVNFSKEAYFDSATFSNFADFSNLIFPENSKAAFDFFKCRLPDTLDFSNNPHLPCDIDLSVADFWGENINYYAKTGENIKHKIFLYKTDVSKFHFDYKHFELIFNTKRAGNKGQYISDDEKETVYEAVLKNFNDRGQKESYKALDIEYQQFKWSRSSVLLKWFGFFDKWWWNFGYNKEWVFLWTLGFIFVFTWLTYYKLEDLQQNVYTIDKIVLYPKKEFIRRLWYSLIYTCTVFFPLALKIDNIVTFKKLWLIYITIVFISGLLCVAYIANFVLAK